MGFSLSFVNWRHFSRLKQQQKTITQQQEMLAQMAYQDALTALPNRRWMDELMKNEVVLVRGKQASSTLVIFDYEIQLPLALALRVYRALKPKMTTLRVRIKPFIAPSTSEKTALRFFTMF